MTGPRQPDWWTPDHEAASREGFLGNPVAVAYAKAEAEGAIPLQPDNEVEVADAMKLVTEWHAIPGTGLEIREVEGPPRLRWHVRPIEAPRD